MSAFVLDTQRFVELAGEIAGRLYGNDNIFLYPLQEFLGINRFHEKFERIDEAAIEKVYSLYLANIEAVNQRYPHDSPEIAAPQADLFHKPLALNQFSDLQFLKHLQCLRYQMTEGTMPNTELFKQLDRLISGMAENIVDSLPEYENCQWG